MLFRTNNAMYFAFIEEGLWSLILLALKGRIDGNHFEMYCSTICRSTFK